MLKHSYLAIGVVGVAVWLSLSAHGQCVPVADGADGTASCPNGNPGRPGSDPSNPFRPFGGPGGNGFDTGNGGRGEATVPPTSGSRGEGVTVDPVVRTAGLVATAATERTRPPGRRSTTREVTGAAAATALTAAVTEEMEAMPTATASIP